MRDCDTITYYAIIRQDDRIWPDLTYCYYDTMQDVKDTGHFFSICIIAVPVMMTIRLFDQSNQSSFQLV